VIYLFGLIGLCLELLNLLHTLLVLFLELVQSLLSNSQPCTDSFSLIE
jgi:hypothetical protein